MQVSVDAVYEVSLGHLCGFGGHVFVLDFSYVSSITLLGHPVEIYLYGIQFIMLLFCYIPLTLSLMYVFIPLYFNLQITSLYEVSYAKEIFCNSAAM